MKPKYWIPIAVVLVLGAFAAGRFTGRTRLPEASPAVVDGAKPEFWTCSMHPQIRQPGPGKCPICAMNLVPVFKDSQTLGPRQVRLSSGAIALAAIRTAPVTRRTPVAEVRMVGKVDYDETRLATITARVPGRLDRLYVDYTGVPVKKGEHLVELYSPQLLAAQEELIQALKAAEELRSSPDALVRSRATQTVEAAREKLRLWGLGDEQVREIEQRLTATDHMTIHAPVGGIVIQKDALEGKYVSEGSPIYTIADLSHLWVRLDAYESDLPWLSFGQKVEFSAEADPGVTFEGVISFIDPVLNPKTRTVKVRVNVDNSDGRLKPEMFVRAVVHARLSATGRAMNPELAGKWISPMHPEIVRDGPGPCPICGMQLVPAESLGLVTAEGTNAAVPLVIPATAPLLTGKRAVVYVALTNAPGIFEGREVTLGGRAGADYLVLDGLIEEEQVVIHGAFKIDSAVQILAQPSMMNPANDKAHAHVHTPTQPMMTATPEFRAQLRVVADAYLPMADALSHDSLERAKAALAALNSALDAVNMALLEGAAHEVWMAKIANLRKGISSVRTAPDLKSARDSFETISNAVISALETFGLSGAPLHVFHCPMAMQGRGADWIQAKEVTENPYYGSAMFTCGERTRTIAAANEGSAP